MADSPARVTAPADGAAAGTQAVLFEYALMRAVPRPERGEFVNVALVLYCQARDFLGCAVRSDLERLRALDPHVDLDAVTTALAGICAVCEGDPLAGLAAAGPLRSRFGWLTAPRSTVVQAGPVHSGLTTEPTEELRRLARKLVD